MQSDCQTKTVSGNELLETIKQLNKLDRWVRILDQPLLLIARTIPDRIRMLYAKSDTGLLLGRTNPTDVLQWSGDTDKANIGSADRKLHQAWCYQVELNVSENRIFLTIETEGLQVFKVQCDLNQYYSICTHTLTQAVGRKQETVSLKQAVARLMEQVEQKRKQVAEKQALLDQVEGDILDQMKITTDKGQSLVECMFLGTLTEARQCLEQAKKALSRPEYRLSFNMSIPSRLDSSSLAKQLDMNSQPFLTYDPKMDPQILGIFENENSNAEDLQYYIVTANYGVVRPNRNIRKSRLQEVGLSQADSVWDLMDLFEFDIGSLQFPSLTDSMLAEDEKTVLATVVGENARWSTLLELRALPANPQLTLVLLCALQNLVDTQIITSMGVKGTLNLRDHEIIVDMFTTLTDPANVKSGSGLYDPLLWKPDVTKRVGLYKAALKPDIRMVSSNTNQRVSSRLELKGVASSNRLILIFSLGPYLFTESVTATGETRAWTWTLSQARSKELERLFDPILEPTGNNSPQNTLVLQVYFVETCDDPATCGKLDCNIAIRAYSETVQFIQLSPSTGVPSVVLVSDLGHQWNPKHADYAELSQHLIQENF